VFTGYGCLTGGGAPGAYDPIYEEFVDDVEEVIRHHPGIDRRNCTVDRCWDVLHFLLSEERRQGNYDGIDLGTIAVYGATEATCFKDWPRYTSPSQAGSILVFLNNITEPELLRWANHKELIEDCYKAPFPDDIIWNYFKELRNLYREAWRYKEAVYVNKS
jgi:hypothetical protein